MKKILFLIFLLYSVNLYSNEAGSKGLLFLNIAPNARVAALGNAFVSQADDTSSIYWNPGGLSALKNMEAGINFISYIEGMSYINLQAAKNFSFGGLGINITSFSYGEIENYVNGVPGTSITPSDIMFSIGYAKELLNNLNIGIGIKYISEQLTDTYSGTGIAVDFGLLYNSFLYGFLKKNVLKPFNFGFVVQNIGAGPKFISRTTSLPMIIKFGFAYKYRFPVAVAKLKDINFILDIMPVTDTGFGIRYGTEFWWYNLPANIDAALRIGLKMPQDLGFLSGITFGAGIRVFNAEFDYSLLNFGDLGIAHQLSLNYKFGKIIKPADIVIKEKPVVKEKKEEVLEEEGTEEELIDEEPTETDTKEIKSQTKEEEELEDESSDTNFDDEDLDEDEEDLDEE